MTIAWLMIIALAVLIGVVGYGFLEGWFDSEERIVDRAESELRGGDPNRAVELFRKAIRSNPQNHETRWRLIEVLEEMGRFEDAAGRLEGLLTEDELPPSVSRDEALEKLASLYENAGLNEDAIDAWSRYLQLNPGSTMAMYRRGQLSYRDRDFDRALKDLRDVRDADGDPPGELPLHLGRCLTMKNQVDRARELYGEYLQGNPDNHQALFEAGQIAQKTGDYEEARTYYEEVRGDAKPPLATRAVLHLLRIAIERENTGESEELLEELERREAQGYLPEKLYLQHQYLRAQFYEQTDRDEEALKLYRSIHSTRPGFLDVQEIIDRKIHQLDDDELLETYMEMDREEFRQSARRMVEMMGFDVLGVDSVSRDEINVTAHERTSNYRVDRILVSFKRWDNNVGEWPIREFELKLVDNRYDRGIFVAPKRFQPSALERAHKAPIRLLGPESLLEYLREVLKQES